MGLLLNWKPLRALWLTAFLLLTPIAPALAELETISLEPAQPLPLATSKTTNRNTDELLKNFMASVSYSPHAVALPEDPPYPELALMSPESGLNGLIPGTDAAADLPAPNDLKAAKAARPAKASKLVFSKPLMHAILSSPFGLRWGRMHEGVDLAVASGTPILAVEAGKVIYSGWADGYGNFVSVDHGGGYVTRYGHASKLLVRVGQKIKKGQTIALVGSTGHSTGPHLHFEVVRQGIPQNPFSLINHTITVSAR